MIDDKIGKAIQALDNTKEYSHLVKDPVDIDSIVWLNGSTPIEKSVIEAKIVEMAYIKKREKEYPSIVDQLDDIYHNGIDGWKATIKTTKDKYPKE